MWDAFVRWFFSLSGWRVATVVTAGCATVGLILHLV
jgi:hypothetical protein